MVRPNLIVVLLLGSACGTGGGGSASAGEASSSAGETSAVGHAIAIGPTGDIYAAGTFDGTIDLQADFGF